MRKLNLFLILILLACYSGFGSRSAYSSVPSNNTTCHSLENEDHVQRGDDAGPTARLLIKKVTDHTAIRCCFESLPNAPQNDHLTFKNQPLGLLLIDNSSHETDKSIIGNLSIGLREHDPPDLYISNSSLLL